MLDIANSFLFGPIGCTLIAYSIRFRVFTYKVIIFLTLYYLKLGNDTHPINFDGLFKFWGPINSVVGSIGYSIFDTERG